HQHFHLGRAEEFADNHAGVSVGCAQRLRPCPHQVHQRVLLGESSPRPKGRFDEEGQVLRLHALVVEFLQSSCCLPGIRGRAEPLKRYRRERRVQSPRAKCRRQGCKVSIGQQFKGVHHSSSVLKNSAPTSSTVGTTTARSRKSLCCSHDVSAISRQPWQAAPCRNRHSCWLWGSCWAQTGSLEHSRPSSRAVRRCRSICRPVSTRPPSVPSASGVPV